MNDKFRVEQLDLWYGSFQGLKQVSVGFPEKRITALIGPSGCGKSTLLRCLNRMNDLVTGVRIEGRVLLDQQDIYAPQVDVEALRRRVGMVFQRPNPFPLSVYDNVAYGPRLHGERNAAALRLIVDRCLQSVGLLGVAGVHLDQPALSLSGEQQQRLCIARALATSPEVLLMDEPCSALDPIATAGIEALMQTLVADYTIVIVTHNMAQALRASHRTGFMLLGELVEIGETDDVFHRPTDQRTASYIAGQYG
ncbi:MAG: phosphate ABC transporter ATP-binding protein PstB [Gemmatimonadaceae bacterium]|nr:phosphate ABC transporter ATP-binding protein PstB [Gemmatimonadaceae bacterium]